MERKRLSPDAWAVFIALGIAILIKFNLFARIPW